MNEEMNFSFPSFNAVGAVYFLGFVSFCVFLELYVHTCRLEN